MAYGISTHQRAFKSFFRQPRLYNDNLFVLRRPVVEAAPSPNQLKTSRHCWPLQKFVVSTPRVPDPAVFCHHFVFLSLSAAKSSKIITLFTAGRCCAIVPYVHDETRAVSRYLCRGAVVLFQQMPSQAQSQLFWYWLRAVIPAVSFLQDFKARLHSVFIRLKPFPWADIIIIKSWVVCQIRKETWKGCRLIETYWVPKYTSYVIWETNKEQKKLKNHGKSCYRES